MRYLRKLLLIAFTLFSVSQTNAQPDSCHLRISLLTCSPGEELYSSWGHTAIRVIDKTNGSDFVFNYGTFDDSDPMFLPKFTKGLMLYSLSAYPFSEFVEEYKYYKRGVIEQDLNLSCESKKNLLNALVRNNQPENRFYNYYFKEDNCTTRARDMILAHAGGNLSSTKILPERLPTYRNLIHEYLDSSHQYWNKLGIDILLGANLDQQVSEKDASFLPDYLLKSFDNTSINNQPLVSAKQTLLATPALPASGPGLSPLLWFSILAALIFILSFVKTTVNQKILNIFDAVFFLLLGILGLLLVVLWIIRIDTVCRNNFNLLWAVPTHLAVAFIIPKRKNWVRSYFKITAILTILLLISFYFLPQQLNTAIIPLLLIILLRSWQRSR